MFLEGINIDEFISICREETDALIAKELADKLKREPESERLRLIQQSEMMARQLQESVLREKKPKPTKHNSEPQIQIPQPPRHLKPTTHQQQQHHQFQEQSPPSPPPPNDIYYSSVPEQYELDLPTNHLNYVSLDLIPPKSNQLPKKSNTPYTQISLANGGGGGSSNGGGGSQFSTPEKKSSSQHHNQINLHSHTPEKFYQQTSTQQQQQHNQRKFDFTFDHESEMNFTGNFNNQRQTEDNHHHKKMYTEQDIADSIRQYNLPLDELPVATTASSSSHSNVAQKHYDDEIKNNSNFKKLSPEKFDYLMGNGGLSMGVGGNNVTNLNGIKSLGLPSPPPQNSSSGHNQNHQKTSSSSSSHQQHNYEDHDRIKTLQELGLPPEEIKEIDRRVQQEKRDEELARKLQQEETVELNQEEKDRLLAMEAQDKELARMLQEREKLKAKRAKEKARLKKIQQLQSDFPKNHPEDGGSGGVIPDPDYPSHSRSISDPHDLEGDSYSTPIDLITSTEMAASSGQPLLRKSNQMPLPNQRDYYNPRENNGDYYREQFSDENYSNPVDMVRANESGASPKIPQNSKKGIVKRDDEMYILPVAGAGAIGGAVGEYQGPIRPNQLDLRGPLNRPAQPRAHVPEGLDNIAVMIDPTYPSSGSTSTTPGAGLSPPG